MNTTWLLEVKKSNPTDEQLYYKSYGRPISGGRDDVHVTNPDPHQAKRFASEKEANEYAEFYGLSGQLVAREHMFDCPTPEK